MPPIVLVEGNIAAGKTTLVREISEKFGLMLCEEPVEANPYLRDFYERPRKYAYKMQEWLLTMRRDVYARALEHCNERGKGAILDRSVWSDWVFADNCRNDGLMTQAEFDKYMALRAELLAPLQKPDLVIYLDVTPNTCLHRIRNVRGRSCEASIELEYLQGIDASYKKWLKWVESLGIPVLTVNRETFTAAVQKEVCARLHTLCPDLPLF